MLRVLIAGGLVAITPGLSVGQIGVGSPVFEAASVKSAQPQALSSDDAKVKRTRTRRSEDPGRITYLSTTLIPVLMRAYDVGRNQISGPAWLESETYDIVAKLPDGALEAQVPAMLQNLLTNRFRMTVRVASKQQPIYALVVGKSGPRLKESQLTVEPAHVSFGAQGHVELIGYALSDFAEFLANALDRPVANLTGIQGRFDISTNLDMATMRSRVVPAMPDAAEQPGDNSSPSIFSAIQDVGLKLEPRNGTAKLIVVEKADRHPTEN